jgi:hypothetical protein
MSTKIFWLFVLVAVSAVSGEGWIDAPKKAIDPPMKIVDPIPQNSKVFDQTVLKPIEDETEPILKPIGPILPNLFQPAALFSHLESLRKGVKERKENLNEQGVDSLKPHKGIMTIILVKSKPHHDQFENAKNDMNNFDNDMLDSAQKNFHSLTSLLMNDIFGKNMNIDEKSIASPHLFGGIADPDHRRQDNGFIRYVTGDQMPPPTISDDIGRYHGHHKKCNFIKFLKLKAHVHYRTIIHLIFLSGVIMIILMMLSLAIKVHKRRIAIRRYAAQQNIDVSSIDSALAKQKEAEGSPKRLLRLGDFKSSYEQKMVPSVLLTSPPAYDQINDSDNVNVETKQRSSLIKQLASAYKNRYQRASNDQQADEDRQSISSLPPYEDKAESKE